MFTVGLSSSFASFANARTEKRNKVIAAAGEHVVAATADPGRRVRRPTDGRTVDIESKLELAALRSRAGAIRTMPGGGCYVAQEFYGDDYGAL